MQDEINSQKRLCKCEDCTFNSIYLEDYCWEHLQENRKEGYGRELLKSLESQRVVENECLNKVVIKDMHFPEFISFKNCDFREAIILRSSFQRADFRGSNFSGACLKDCHFEYSDFRGILTLFNGADLRESHFDGALLQNADLTGADLRDAILVDVDMIGAKLQNAKLYSSRILNARLRKEGFCNYNHTKSKRIKVGDEYYKNLDPPPKGPCSNEGPDDVEGPMPLLARFVYTTLKNNFKALGEYEDVRWSYYKEQTMERKRLFRLWRFGDRWADALAIEHWLPEEKERLFESRIIAFLRWLYECFRFCFAYGTNFKIVLIISILIILLFSFLFMFSGFEYCTVKDGNRTICRNLEICYDKFDETFEDFITSFYMSVVTFTTLGYGDAHPLGFTRILACIEAMLGLVLMSLLVAILARGLWTGQ